MTYFEQIPTKPLCRYIEKFWYCQAGSLTAETLTIPLVRHELIINFSDNYSVKRHSKPDYIVNNLTTWINGIQTIPTITWSSGRHEMIGVLFKADGLKAFTQYHSDEFTNNYLDTTLVFGNSFERVLDEIQNADGGLPKISVLESYLLRKLKSKNYPNYFNVSLQLFSLDKNFKISVQEACDRVGISNKSLIQSYQKYIGVNPSKYLQLQTINRAIAFLSKDPKQSLTKMAYKLNFFDQAHFIHSFKSVTDMSPSQYCNAVLRHNVDKQSPNFIFHQG